MKTITLDEFIREVSRVVNAAPRTITVDQELRQLPRWDSMAILDFLAMADERCGLEISTVDLKNCKTVGDLAKMFQGHIVG